MAQFDLPAQFSDLMSLRSLKSTAPSIIAIRRDREDDLHRVPHISHRYASPSAPWAWLDREDKVDLEILGLSLPPIPPLCSHKDPECKSCWVDYPQSRFPSWTEQQIKRSRIDAAIHEYNREKLCVIYRVDVDSHGLFSDPGQITAELGQENDTWSLIGEEHPEGTKLRAMFIENMTGRVLQMIGTKYNIEPLFWSSSLNRIPSCSQEEVQAGTGDHITLTLTSLWSMSSLGMLTRSEERKASTFIGTQGIDPHVPLALHSIDRVLTYDFLAVHLIRNVNGSTIISFHPALNIPTTEASFLHERTMYVGRSAYWQSIFQTTPDPIFMLLIFIWHASYGWDEALEDLYSHICYLETQVLLTSSIPLIRELHLISPYHLYYMTLLEECVKHITFIRDMHNPFMERFPDEKREFDHNILKRECASLLSEFARFRSELIMQENRVKNILGLVNTLYNQEMIEATLRDNAGNRQYYLHISLLAIDIKFCCPKMKRISYLGMVFLPASFVAGIFGMNVSEINTGSLGTLSQYLAVAIPLTWFVIAVQSKDMMPPNTGFFRRLGWPMYLLMYLRTGVMKKAEDSKV